MTRYQHFFINILQIGIGEEMHPKFTQHIETAKIEILEAVALVNKDEELEYQTRRKLANVLCKAYDDINNNFSNVDLKKKSEPAISLSDKLKALNSWMVNNEPESIKQNSYL